jgi:hypothetical protein
MNILIHSSKTIKTSILPELNASEPIFKKEATQLSNYLKKLSKKDIESVMHVSSALAEKTRELNKNWGMEEGMAIYSFRGDVYSGLQSQKFNSDDIMYAQNNLRIISGLYGILKPLDIISPYRLEMGYVLPKKEFSSLYKFWGEKLAQSIRSEELSINLTSIEYGKAIIPYLNPSKFISPIFYTYNHKLKKYVNVAVHSKIARGAFANWLIKNRVDNISKLKDFKDLGYKYDAQLSSKQSPVFVCNEFGGKGLSTRNS